MNNNVLWTGGWDSTYRVLDLVINKKKVITPFYILDENRKSTKMELKTMQLIRNMVEKEDGQASDRINDLIIINKNSIPPNNKITDSYKKLSKESHLGAQYDWLARYTNSIGISDLELCIHADDTVEDFINNDVELVENGEDKYYKLQKHLSKPELFIFSYYHYPLFDMTKINMEEQAKISGFDHIMEITWFCHSPNKDQPCGMCNPCKYTKEEGLGRRVPKPSTLFKIKRKIYGKLNGLRKKS